MQTAPDRDSVLHLRTREKQRLPYRTIY
jgi:hypothetical protein